MTDVTGRKTEFALWEVNPNSFSTQYLVYCKLGCLICFFFAYCMQNIFVEQKK